MCAGVSACRVAKTREGVARDRVSVKGLVRDARMKRSHAVVAIALSSLLPSAAASPPVRPRVVSETLQREPVLSATRAEDRALIAFHYAPIHRQEVDRSGDNGLDGRADYVTRVDFDGDWDSRNNWENAGRFPLPGAAYYSVVETLTHWFVTIMFFHPRDWASSPFDTEHENDSEGILLAVRRDGSRFGRVEAGVTVAHSNFYSFVPARGRWSPADESVDGVLELDSRSGRPMTTQEARGHALRAWRSGVPFDGIVYYPSLAPVEPPSPHARTAAYALLDIFAPGGLWERRDSRLFSARGAFAGDRGGACGSGGILCTTNAANAPWGWDDHDDGDVGRGDIACDPVKLVTRYFRAPERVSRAYTHNPYRSTSAPESELPLLAAGEVRRGRAYGERVAGVARLSETNGLRRP
jgi:hypothetical protein